jgi:hypothetical protein
MSRKRNLDSRSLDTSLPFTRDNANRDPRAQEQRESNQKDNKRDCGKAKGAKSVSLYTQRDHVVSCPSARVTAGVGPGPRPGEAALRRLPSEISCKKVLEFSRPRIFFNVRKNLTRSRFFCVCETNSTRPRFFRRGGVWTISTRRRFFGVCGRKFQGNYETIVGGNDGTNWWATRTRKGRKGRRKIRVGFTHGRARRRSVRWNGFFQGLFHRREIWNWDGK